MDRSDKFDRQARVEKVRVGDVVTLNASKDAIEWEVLGVQGRRLKIQERGTEFAPESYPRDCVYDVAERQKGGRK